MKQRTLEIILKASDQASAVIGKVGKGLGGIGKAGATAAAGIGAVNKGIEGAFNVYSGVMSSGIVQAGQMVHVFLRVNPFHHFRECEMAVATEHDNCIRPLST